MLVWRLKRGDKSDLTFSFQPGVNESSKDYYIKRLIERPILDQMISNKVVTVGGVSFIADDGLSPEVVEQADGHFQYFLSQKEIRITEIPIQTSANELILEVRERSKIYIVKISHSNFYPRL